MKRDPSSPPNQPRPDRSVGDGLATDVLTPTDGVLARLWLMGPGDLCSTCPMRPECPDQRACLHLVASAGSTARVDGPFRRFPIGARRVGQVAATHEPFVAREALGEFADPLWIEMHRVKSFAAVSLERSGQSRGVLAVFSRRVLSDQDVAFLALTARVAARSLSPAPRAAAPAGAAKEPRATLAQVQREAIERVLIETRGRVSGPRGAALILGLKPSTLVSRMQKLGVRRPQR